MSYRWMPFSGASSPFLKSLNVEGDEEPRPKRQTSAIVERLGQVNPPSSQSVDDRDLLSEPQAVFNLTNTVLGVGVLSVPYAFRLSGYVMLPLVLVVIAVTSTTANFIGAALVLAGQCPEGASTPPRARDFAYLAHVAFGNNGRIFIGTVTSLEIWFALVTFMVMNGVNAALLFPALGATNAVLISCALMASTVFVPMRILSYLSLLSSVALCFAAASLFGAAMTMHSWYDPYEHLGSIALMQIGNIPRSVGIVVFCFAGHPCFPIVHESMQNPQKWRPCVGITFFVAFLYYGGLGTFGYIVFGENLEASFTINISSLSSAAFWRNMSAFGFLIKIQLTAPLLLNAIMVSCMAPAKEGPEWTPVRIFVLLLCSGLTAVMAVTFSHQVALVASLTGSLFTMTTSVLFPALVHLQLSRRSEREAPKRTTGCWQHCLVLLFGTTMAVSGTALAAKDFIAGGFDLNNW